jgi:ElaB/YqjD/DUF883 family membrane-anchored ribosome-binding protein
MKFKGSTTTSPEEILAELRALVAEAEAMVNHTLDTSDDVVATLRARYEAAQERLLDAYAAAKRKAVTVTANADDAIRSNPYRSLAIAAGAGMLMGLLFALRKGRSAAVAIVVLVLTMGCMTVAAQRGQGQGQGQRRGAMVSQMSGTYELEATRGDDVQRAAQAATRNLPGDRRDRAFQNLLMRLQPPSTLAIDRNGRTFTVSSSNGPRTSFEADGGTRNETGVNRRAVATRVEYSGNRLTVTSRGNRNTDFMVTFEPIDNGGLLVTRRMDSDDLARPVTVRSYYRRVADPRWDLYTPDNSRRADPRAFVVPDGTRMVAVLDTPISSRTSRSGQRFSMTVQGPNEYRDARIDGVIDQITPYGNGRNTEMRVDFDTIRLRNGQTAEFEAILSDVRSPNGRDYRIDAPSQDRDPNRTGDTLQQGAVGAALGAIIGAIAGGGKGAAIGAVVGGAGGMILAQDREQYLDLPAGTQVTLIVTSSRFRNP